MELSFRWYGPKDQVTLSDIRQSNAEYIVTSLHQIPTGEKWSNNAIKKLYFDNFEKTPNFGCAVRTLDGA